MGHELGVFTLKRYTRRGCGIDCGDFVEKIGKPHEFLVVSEIKAPHSVVDHLVADVYFFGQRFLSIMKYGSSEGEVVAESVAEIETEQRFALGGEHRLVFERHAYALSRINYALVGNSDYSH